MFHTPYWNATPYTPASTSQTTDEIEPNATGENVKYTSRNTNFHCEYLIEKDFTQHGPGCRHTIRCKMLVLYCSQQFYHFITPYWQKQPDSSEVTIPISVHNISKGARRQQAGKREMRKKKAQVVQLLINWVVLQTGLPVEWIPRSPEIIKKRPTDDKDR